MTGYEYKYWAYLSYSQQDNLEQRAVTPELHLRCWGNWLHDALKSFAIPAEFTGQINGRGEIIPERIDPIFRDEQELPAAANLSEEVCKALEQTICLVVICSPRSSQSRQMNEVVRYFKQLGRGHRILPFVIAGEPNASSGNKPGLSPEDECFVPALRHPVLPDGTIDVTRRAGRHIFVDARHGVDKREILATDHRNAEADLEMAKIQLIALLVGVGFHGLWWREQKRHFFAFAEAQRQARQALNQVEELRGQLQEAQRQTRAAQDQALEMQKLPRAVHSQIQEVQNQALEAQIQAREAQKQLQEFQTKIQDTQNQLEEARNRALAAERKILEMQNQARATQLQLEETQPLNRETQDTESELAETRSQAQAAHSQLLEAQNQVQEFQSQARILASQLEETRNSVQKTQDRGHNARRLKQALALLAVLTILAAGTAARMAWRERQMANAALVQAAEAAGIFKLPSTDWNQEQIRQLARDAGPRCCFQLSEEVPPNWERTVPLILKTLADGDLL